MSEVFGDDFPDVFSTVLNDAETAAATRPALLFRHLGELGGLHICEVGHAASDTLPVCPACHHVRVQQLQDQVAELEAAATRPVPAPAFRHLYRANTPYPGTTECGRPWTQEDAEGQPGRLSLPVCLDCVRKVLDRLEETQSTLGNVRRDRDSILRTLNTLRATIREAADA